MILQPQKNFFLNTRPNFKIFVGSRYFIFSKKVKKKTGQKSQNHKKTGNFSKFQFSSQLNTLNPCELLEII